MKGICECPGAMVVLLISLSMGAHGLPSTLSYQREGTTDQACRELKRLRGLTNAVWITSVL